jgi:hypothetical protein
MPRGVHLAQHGGRKSDPDDLEVFSPWKAPANFKIHSFVIRVGDWGGYIDSKGRVVSVKVVSGSSAIFRQNLVVGFAMDK